MSNDTEQIGELVFRPNPEYPYPFAVERPPHFWMTEETGVLSAAVEAYFDGERLTPPQVAVIKAYLRQYIERAMLTADAKRHLLLQQIEKLRTTREIERFADEVAEYGVEPF
jgi:hypothetical protein